MTPKKQIEKNPVGKPLKFTIEDVENIISQYFDETPESEYTVTGLALLFGSKQLLADYEKRDGYSEIIRKAKLRVENSYEKDLKSKGSTGAIFALKNFGWSDKQETEHTINQPIQINID